MTRRGAGSGLARAQMGNANLNPWTQPKVNTNNPDRGPDAARGCRQGTVPAGTIHSTG
jgi:non-heme chloroperoxidase